ncbi:MAG: hypothetical protein U0165_06495 [Polyangiaceae bacterium]
MSRPSYSTQASRAVPEGMSPPTSQLVDGQVQIVTPPPMPVGFSARQVPLWLALALAGACLFFGVAIGVLIGKA